MAASGHYFWTVFCIIFACGVSGSRYKHFHRAPLINLNGAEELIGSIREDERIVTLSPQLRIMPETGPVCRYDLTSLDGSSKELPFESEVLNKSEGTVKIRLRDGAAIDCSNTEWRVQVTAVRCADDTARSEPVTLKILVKDTNNHAPQFEAPWYTFEVDEGKVTDIARIFATDADCGHPYGKICRYEITNSLDGNPFEIDDQGVLSTTKPLNHSQAESHILTVVAHDCGMLRSKSTLITVHVRPKCVDGMKSDSKQPVRFAPGSGGARLFGPDAEIFMCPKDDTCTVKDVEAQVDLHLKSITQVDIEIAKECGLQTDTLDLLPQTTDPPKETKSLFAEDEEDDEDLEVKIAGEDEQKYLFNGKSNAVIISPNVIKRVIPESFTLSFVMKHKGDPKDSEKQNLLCETDDFGMNRHHFSVYIRHCKLELLLRRESEGAPAEFRAAEWRWTSPSVCDGHWHSYAIIFADLDNVTLLLDGERFTENERNPEILDDWPLHETKEHKTKLVVGACWHGRNQAMVQFFNGHLSSMFLLPGAVEPESTLQCLHKHSERLSLPAIDHLLQGESMIFDHEQTQLTLRAKTLKNLTSLLKEIEFVAGPVADTSAKIHSVRPGSRTFSVTTRVTCLDNRTIPLGTFQSSVNVVKPDTPHLSISGQNLVSTERRNIKKGVLMLPNAQITITQNIDGIESDVTTKYSLDWCKVHLKPSRDMDLEYFSSPASLITHLNFDFEHDKQGIMLKGEDSVKNYVEVLSRIQYFNSRPEVYNKRMYTVHCSMQGGKVISNEFSVTMTIVDDSIEEAIEKLSSLSKKIDSAAVVDDEEIMKLEKHFEPSFDQLGANRLQNILEMDLPRPKALLSHHGYEVGGQGAVAGGAVAIVVVICIGFLLVLLVIGVLKLRDHSLPKRRRSRKPTAEGMEWDDNGLNITVNPLENINKSNQSDMFSEDESVDDEESCHEDDDLTEDDDEDAEAVLPHNGSNQKNGLEWDDEHDDGPLTHSQHSYRV